MQQKQHTLVQVICCVLLVLLLGFMSSVHDTDLDEVHHQHHQCELFHFSQQWLPATEFVWPVVHSSPPRSVPLVLVFFSIIVLVHQARAPPSFRSFS
ncbi:DUF2607 family protein [Marinomonas flavescens]|uniref:DUF2607 family protein n=1 Tax=Marinomonas flavescens TaxID=2529379 RepID=UPI0010568E59|nr:DUF2607 family protein [Marinomonas flavescens]